MNAKAAADYLIYITQDVFDDLTNMKLNKLLYFAQGHCLNKYGRPLFNDKIEAWEYGPVVPNVYAYYKNYGNNPIFKSDSDDRMKKFEIWQAHKI